MTTSAEHDRLSGCRVLVVDDNVDAADSVALMLQALGAEVHVAYDGPSAVELTRDRRPRVVLQVVLPVVLALILTREDCAVLSFQSFDP